MTNRKTGTYYLEEISFGKKGKPKYRYSKNFNTRKEAVSYGRQQHKKGKFTQARIWFSKNIISDVESGSIDLHGRENNSDVYGKTKAIAEHYHNPVSDNKGLNNELKKEGLPPISKKETARLLGYTSADIVSKRKLRLIS